MSKPILYLLSLFFLINLTFAERITVQAAKFRSENRKLIYTGNVILKTDKGKIVNCERLVIFLNKDGGIDRAIASGHVKYSDRKYKAVGNIMVYIPSKKLIILEGNALVKSEKGIITGDKVIYNLENDTLRAVSNKRVQTVFEIEENKRSTTPH